MEAGGTCDESEDGRETLEVAAASLLVWSS